ncbi:MAG: glycoside hydrolase family 28 protein [Pirellulales bacterium]|nr:glycoside hydrolase family 28 protein [Pirellulales bacterium]
MLLAAIGVAPATGSYAESKPAQAADPWIEAAAIVARIKPPTFPTREFSVADFGATADANADCTSAFRAAIAACNEAGGGRVVVPVGVFRTGPIHLASGVEFHLSEGAKIVFSDAFADYLPPVLVRVGGVELYNYSPLVYARDATDVAVTGKGKLDGNAGAWWDWKSRETRRGFELAAAGVPVEKRVFGVPEAAIRPSFVSLVNCRNVLFEDFTIGSGPNWTIHPVYCENVTIRRVQVTTDGPNNDGVDPDSCRDVLIEDCVFDTGDDCVVLKSGYNEDGWRVARPTENVVMRRCTSLRGHGGLVVGSEMSGDVRNVFMEDCEFQGTDRAIRIKSRADRGGIVERIYARNLRLRDMQREAIILNMDYGSDRSELKHVRPPVFRDMAFEGIESDGSPAAIVMQALPDSPIENVVVRNGRFSARTGVHANHVRNLRFENVGVVPERGPAYALADASDVTIVNPRVPAGVRPFVILSGANSRNVVIGGADVDHSAVAVELGDEVPRDAVVVK